MFVQPMALHELGKAQATQRGARLLVAKYPVRHQHRPADVQVLYDLASRRQRGKLQPQGSTQQLPCQGECCTQFHNCKQDTRCTKPSDIEGPSLVNMDIVDRCFGCYIHFLHQHQGTFIERLLSAKADHWTCLQQWFVPRLSHSYASAATCHCQSKTSFLAVSKADEPRTQPSEPRHIRRLGRGVYPYEMATE
jgi:hypothetical protein